jgi:pSer/pThr/pTyr-binding forkhead associated (FHA) protein
MTLSPQFDAPSAVRDRATDSRGPIPMGFMVRVHGGIYDGRVVRVSTDKCTIGRSPDCTIRLSSPEFEPLHCLIVRGQGGVVVRCWSEGKTKLNGEDFSVSWMEPGDRLGVGPIELELLNDTGEGQSSTQSLAPTASSPSVSGAAGDEAAAMPTSEESDNSKRQLEQLLEERQNLFERLSLLELKLQETNDDRDRLRVAVDELGEEIAGVTRLRQQWQRERDELERQLYAARERVNLVDRHSEPWEERLPESSPYPGADTDLPPAEANELPLGDDHLVDMKAVLARYGVVMTDYEDAIAAANEVGPGAARFNAVAATTSREDSQLDASSTADSTRHDEVTAGAEPTGVARRQSPIPRINLSAMRDVANQTARVDIDRAAHRHGLKEAAFKWSMALAAIAIGWFVTLILKHDIERARVLSAACWIIAVWWSFLGLMFYRRAVLTNPNRRRLPDGGNQ